MKQKQIKIKVMRTMFEVAMGEYGLKEIRGSRHEERILEYFGATNHSWVKTDETAWCSAFMNWCAMMSGMERTGELNARSWLDSGTEVTTPRMGDVVVFWRERKSSWKGHVGLVASVKDGRVWVLGGNQKNMVCISSYPESRVLKYVRLNRI